MLNNKNNIFVKAMFFVVLAIVLIVGVTYAYFSADITGVESESTISVGGATLAIKYEGTETITGENVIPGWTDKKYFNVDVTNTSRKDISYDINLVVTNSNFNTTNASGNSYLEYALYECSSEADTTCETVIKSSSVLDIQSGDKLVYTATTNTSIKTYYALELSFPNQDAVQSQTGTDGEILTFNGYVTIDTSDKVYVNDNEIAEPASFASDSWATIAAYVKANKEATASVYSVGSEKEVEIDMDDNGTPETYIVRIANNSNYDCTLDSKTACGFVVEFVDIIKKRAMNTYNSNAGGWPATEMKTYLNGTFKSKLPSDLQNVLANTTVVSGHGLSYRNSERKDGNWESTDQLYLLSSKEVFLDGSSNAVSSYDTAYNSTRQLDYYANNNVTTSNYGVTIKKNNAGYAALWWLRAARSDANGDFLAVYPGGNWNASNAGDTSGGLAPAFRIG